ncbi:two-component system cell cycle sensor histidine kinase/response regulator CckA [Albidovulum inexpectatum]|uniref:histidine kinase n=1 Tax=Albidovulum inexpectatum TaxID=196587 RepID=A0A2S5JI83_9RHOB|nr:PAS domain-containing sensor histidine kinase [Albidovulum inexpectatum]PPB81246.1 two-component system cell cycle sensor histidine kinase/response regulator CckA [Albidovulum inexpectatum]
MTVSAQLSEQLTRGALAAAPVRGWLALCAGLCASVGLILPEYGLRLAVVGIALTLAVATVLIGFLAGRPARLQSDLGRCVERMLRHDAVPGILTDVEGVAIVLNPAARNRFGAKPGVSFARILGAELADPAPLVRRLHARAQAEGAASEDVVTLAGRLRLDARDLGAGCILWQVADIAAEPENDVRANHLPMAVVSEDGSIVSMNDAMQRLTGNGVKRLDDLVLDMPIRPGEEHLVVARDGATRRTVLWVDAGSGRHELYVLPASPVVAHDGESIPFEALPVALVRLDGHGRIVQVNRAARELLGEVAIGAELAGMMEGLGRPVGAWLNDALAGRGDGRPEVLKIRRKDRETFLQVSLTRVSVAGEAGLVAVLWDATQLKRLEAQFVQAQKMQAIGQLAGGVAHDFNNLLTAISGHCDLLLLRHDKSDPDYADLIQISQNANRAAALVGQLLAFSRKQTLKLERIDLHEVLADLGHLLNRLVGEKVRLKTAVDPDLAAIRADRRQLEQVLMNLVVNARDAMPQGGEVRIEARNETLAEALNRDRASVSPGDYVVLRVIDEGTGIPGDLLTRIFEPFFTTKRQGEGTGLGLSTVYGIVKQTGGYIFCDSAEGDGTTFTIYLPVCSESDAVSTDAPARPATRSLDRGTNEVILLVEDEAPVRAFASRALRLRGYQVIEADSAEAALQILSDDNLHVDVFVTDVIMPGMDGPSWVMQALERRPDVRVIFVSGYSEESLSELRDRVPNSVFLPKPFSLNDLTETVWKVLSETAE